MQQGNVMKKPREQQPDKAVQTVKAETVRIKVAGVEREFDINEPDLPGWIRKKALRSGDYPYDDKMDRQAYATELEALQVELVKMQAWLQATGNRVMVVFEGRDAAGKGGTIDARAR